MSFPFIEEQVGNRRIRTFGADTVSEELVWHRDDEDRTVHVLEGAGWYFQRDDELPVPMKEGDIIHVRRHEWHRVISRQGTRLVIEIRT